MGIKYKTIEKVIKKSLVPDKCLCDVCDKEIKIKQSLKENEQDK